MRSIVTVTTPAASTDLTTLANAKADLGIAGTDSDGQLAQLIRRASDTARAYLGRRLARVTVTETFRPETGPGPTMDWPDALPLTHWPDVSVASAAVDDDDGLAASEYEVDPETGLLYRLDAQGYRSRWEPFVKVVVSYTGGWLLPGDAGRTLPYDIEAGVLAEVRSLWYGRRDPSLRAVDIPGVQSETYWVPTGSDAESVGISPAAEAFLYKHRRIL